MKAQIFPPAALALLTISLIAAQAEDDWPEDDPPRNPHQVGAGELQFIVSAESATWLHSDSHLSIRPQSLHDGWVGLFQCYENLDAVADVEVVYHYREMRALRVVSSKHIARAIAGESAVRLHDVGRQARLCIAADVKILERLNDGHFRLRNGPFHHRFLDGYFPMRVTLGIDYPDDRLVFTRLKPQPRAGLALEADKAHVGVDTRFSGVLELEFRFRTTAQ